MLSHIPNIDQPSARMNIPRLGANFFHVEVHVRGEIDGSATKIRVKDKNVAKQLLIIVRNE